MMANIVDFYLLIPIFLGIVTGIATGMLAGIGIATAMFVFLPVLSSWPVSWVVAFYVSLLCVSQYMSSVTSLYFAIPGETSSIPAAKESNNLIKAGQLNAALSLCSLGSLIGSILAISVFIAVGAHADTIVLFFKSSVQAMIMIIAAILVMFSGNNRVLPNIALSLLGYAMGQVGYNPFTNIDFLTFDNDVLRTGIPVAPALVGIWIIPMIFKEMIETSDLRRNLPRYNILDGLRYVPQQLGTMFRGSVIGSFLGLVPGLSFVLSSSVSYFLEKSYRRVFPSRLGTPLHAVVASETANNAGILTMLIPLFLLGLPITISESIVYNVLYGSMNYAAGEFIKQQMPTVIMAFVIASVFAVLASWPFARAFASLYKRTQTKIIIAGMILVLVAMVIHSGNEYNQELYYAAVIAFFVPLGFLLRRYDLTPLVFMFIMQHHLENTIYKFMQVHF